LKNMTKKNLFFCLLGALLALNIGCASLPNKTETDGKLDGGFGACKLQSKQYDWNQKHPPKLVWISLDSLNLAGLTEFVGQLKDPHPKGLLAILKAKHQNKALTIHDPTITASSHISTMTCSPAATHGIFANLQWTGKKMSVGFSEPFATETFATTLAKSGLKVVTAGYPALDNSEVGRSVSEGIAYGDGKSKSALYALFPGKEYKHSWTDDGGHTIAELQISAANQGFPKINCRAEKCIIEKTQIANLQQITVVLQDFSYRGYAQFISGSAPAIYISALASNKSFPNELRQKLDSCGLIFSPGKDTSLSKYGAEAIVPGLEHRLNYFNDIWRRYLPTADADAIFLYLEDLDSLRHQFLGDSKARATVLNHVAKVDRVLGEFIESLPASTNLLVMGDHGMATVEKEFNVRRILPENVLKESFLVTSGGTLLLYGRKSQANDLKANPNSDELKWLKDAQTRLLQFNATREGKKLIAKAFIKDSKEMKEAGLSHPNAPFLVAFANTPFSLQDSLSQELIVSDLTNPSLPEPRPRGQHGHASEDAQMKTFISFWGPQFEGVSLDRLKTNTDVVAAVAEALQWPTPSQCRRLSN